MKIKINLIHVWEIFIKFCHEYLNNYIQAQFEKTPYVAEKRKRKEEQQELENNDQDIESEHESSVESDNDFRSLAPVGVQAPKDRKTFETIERTAKFIENSDNPHMEIIIQTKQSGNPQFSFLNKNDSLNPFFLHIRKLLKIGLYNYSLYSDSDNESDTNADTAAKPDPTPPLPESDAILECIETIVPYIARNGTQLEKMLIENHQDDTKYRFLSPNHKDHQYYKYRLEQFIKQPEPIIKYTIDKEVLSSNNSTSEPKTTPPPATKQSTDHLTEEQKIRLARVQKFLQSKKQN